MQSKDLKEEKEHEYCLRCGRRLKTVESRMRGYGSVCEKKLSIKHIKPLFTVY